MSSDNKTLNTVVKELLDEKSKKNPSVVTNGVGVGLQLASKAVQKALSNTINNSNKKSKE